MSESFDTNAEAVASAKRVKAMLSGKGWRIRAYAACGQWHVTLTLGLLSLSWHESDKKPHGFHTLMNDKRTGLGGGVGPGAMPFSTMATYYSTPDKAVQAQLNVARSYVDHVADVVEEVEAAFKHGMSPADHRRWLKASKKCSRCLGSGKIIPDDINFTIPKRSHFTLPKRGHGK